MSQPAKIFRVKTAADRAVAAEFIRTLMPDRQFEVTVKPYRQKRSIQQNRLYFGYRVKPLADFCGYSVNQMHEQLCIEYFGAETKTFRGRTFQVPHRTTTDPEVISVIDMQGLIQLAEAIAAEYGVVLCDEENNEKETQEKTT